MLAPLDHQGLAALLANQVGGFLHPLDIGHVLFGVLDILIEALVELAHGGTPIELAVFDIVKLLLHARGVSHVEDVGETFEQKVRHHHA